MISPQTHNTLSNHTISTVNNSRSPKSPLQPQTHEATIPKEQPTKCKEQEWTEAGYLQCERDRQKHPAELGVFTFALYLRQEELRQGVEKTDRIRMEYQRGKEGSR